MTQERTTRISYKSAISTSRDLLNLNLLACSHSEWPLYSKLNAYLCTLLPSADFRLVPLPVLSVCASECVCGWVCWFVYNSHHCAKRACCSCWPQSEYVCGSLLQCLCLLLFILCCCLLCYCSFVLSDSRNIPNYDAVVDAIVTDRQTHILRQLQFQNGECNRGAIGAPSAGAYRSALGHICCRSDKINRSDVDSV